MSVRRAQREIDSAEFAEWIVYWHLEPFGDEWERTGLLASLMANLWGKDKTTVADWMPKRRWKVQEQSQEDVAMNVDHFFRMMAKSRGRKGK